MNNERVAEDDSSTLMTLMWVNLEVPLGKPNIIVPLILAITYRNEVIVIAMHEVIAVVRSRHCSLPSLVRGTHSIHRRFHNEAFVAFSLHRL